MKLKEKLAREFAQITIDELQNMNNVPKQSVASKAKEVGFLAGFEKARELSVKEWKDAQIRYNGQLYELAFRSIEADLNSLGEEEV